MPLSLAAEPVFVSVKDLLEQVWVSLAQICAWAWVRLGGHEGGQQHGSAVPNSAARRPAGLRL